jgi:hypothetical protein
MQMNRFMRDLQGSDKCSSVPASAAEEFEPRDS